MIEALLFFVTLLGVISLSIFCAHRLRIEAGLAPLLVLCATILWYSLMGCLDLLFPAGMIWCATALAAAIYLLTIHRRVDWKGLFSPGFVFFLIAGFAVAGLFAVRQPIFMDWDEFSFWGIAAKVVKCTDRLYTFEPGSMIGVTYVPGMIMLDYAFQFLGFAFVPWKVLAAYDVFLFAVFAAGISMCRRRDWHLAVPLAVIFVLIPYLLTVSYRDIYVRTTYMSSYADIPMGILFGAGMAAYFSAKKKTPAVLFTAALAVTVASITKDMGFALCLVAAAVICFDLLFLERGEVAFFHLKGLTAKLCWCAVMVLLPVAAFLGWALHMGAALGVSRFDLGGSGQMGMIQMVTTGAAELMGIGTTEKFTQVTGEMIKAFFNTQLTMFGSGFGVVLVILLLLAAAWLCGGPRQKRTAAWFALLSSLGFAAFYVFNIFTYVYIFGEAEASVLSNYSRYIYPYYIGWMLSALVLLGRSLTTRGAEPVGGRTLARQAALFAVPYLLMTGLLIYSGAGTAALWVLLAAGAVGTALLLGFSFVSRVRMTALVPLGLTLVSAFCCARVYSLVQPQLSVVDYPDSYFAERKENIRRAEEIKDRLGENERLLYVCTGDDGGSWFKRYYDFYPEVILDYSLGGTGFNDESRLNMVSVPRFFTQEQAQYFTSEGVTLTPEVLCQYLRTSGCSAIWLEEVDEPFRELYGSLFTDGLSGENDLYRIEQTAEDMRFVPIPEEVSTK